MKLAIATALALSLVACFGGDPGTQCDTCFDPPDAGPVCHINDLSGNWRVAYVEGGAGTCGPLNDRLTAMSLDAYLAGCEVTLADTSPDECEWALDYECINSFGVMRWVEVVNFVSATQLVGVGNVQAETQSGGFCASTYDITMTQL